MLGGIFTFFKNAQQLGKFKRLIREVSEPFSPSNIGRINLSSNKRDSLQELAELMSGRPGISAVLDSYHIEDANKANELIRLFHKLISNGAGQWVAGEFVPTAVLYDVNLLELVLQIEKRNEPNSDDKMAILALKYIENRIFEAA